ncbi:hypothetical protein [Palleronia marisminoris]|uniref:hypothetical protein n=1 Tax=Palleronia marisminoris TaxID=315423 RepID=UPI0015875BCD|nr:hypothetical protein [Palleronia marisminoris]
MMRDQAPAPWHIGKGPNGVRSRFAVLAPPSVLSGLQLALGRLAAGAQRLRGVLEPFDDQDVGAGLLLLTDGEVDVGVADRAEIDDEILHIQETIQVRLAPAPGQASCLGEVAVWLGDLVTFLGAQRVRPDARRLGAS